jgi:type II secretory pathway component PulF
VLVPVYGLVALIIYASQSRHGERWRAIMETLLRPVPILGTARHQLALARLSAALGALLSAGVTIIEAWEMGADASGSLAMRRTVYAWRPELMGGRTPAEMVSKSPRQFPDLFASQYHSGEISGSLDEVLRTLHRYYQAEGSQNLNLLAVWVPRVVYLAVALMIAYRVVSFWTGYFAQAMSAGGL